jgi:predicted Zn-dependent protease
MKRRLSAIAFCVLMAGCAQCSAQATTEQEEAKASGKGQQSDQELVDSGHVVALIGAKTRITQRKYKDALAQLGTITPNTPEEHAAKLILAGQCFEGLNDSPRALSAYRKAQSVAPSVPVGILREGVLEYRQGHLGRARDLLARYAHLEPGNPEVFCYLYFCAAIYDDESIKTKCLRRILLLDDPSGTWMAKVRRGPGQTAQVE